MRIQAHNQDSIKGTALRLTDRTAPKVQRERRPVVPTIGPRSSGYLRDYGHLNEKFDFLVMTSVAL